MKPVEVIVPKDHLYDGWIYRQFLDPGLAGIRRRITKLVPQGSRVLDVGCGTGDQLVHISGMITSGLGIELSQRMLTTAQHRAAQGGLDHLRFELGDASKLFHLEDNSFDIAMASMVIHEMPEAKRLPVLEEMQRLGQKVILVDWICPQANRLKSWSTHFVERMAGREHYAGYRSFMKNGGIPSLLDKAGLNTLETQVTSKGTIQVWVCEPS